MGSQPLQTTAAMVIRISAVELNLRSPANANGIDALYSLSSGTSEMSKDISTSLAFMY